MATFRSVTSAVSSAGQALLGTLRAGWEKARSGAKRAARSGEARIAQLFSAGGHYTYPGGWSLDKQEQVRHYRLWYYVGAQTICNAYACRQPQLGYRRPPMEDKERQKNKRLLDRYQRRKSLTHLQQHEDIELVDSDHPLLKLLNNPNPPDVAYTARFREMLSSCLTGEAFQWKVRNNIPGPKGRQVAELWPIFSQWCEPIGGTTKLIEKFRIRPTVGSGAGGFEIPAEDMIAVLDPSPLSLVHGWSPLRAGAEWVDTGEAMDTAQWNLFENGLWPTVLMETDPDVFGPNGPDQGMMTRFKARFKEATAGRDKHGEPIILSPGLKAVMNSRGPVEMDFVNSGDASRNRVLSLLGVGKFMAGLSEDVNRATANAAMENFHRQTMGPRFMHRAQVLTEQLAQDFDEELVLFYPEFTADDPEQLNKDIETDRAAFAITPNEVRKLRGREPFELGGDNPVGPGGLPLPWNVEEESGVDQYGEMQADREQSQQALDDAVNQNDDVPPKQNGKAHVNGHTNNRMGGMP